MDIQGKKSHAETGYKKRWTSSQAAVGGIIMADYPIGADGRAPEQGSGPCRSGYPIGDRASFSSSGAPSGVDSIDIQAGIYMADRAGMDAAALLARFRGITAQLH